jgi:hypothetical protein
MHGLLLLWLSAVELCLWAQGSPGVHVQDFTGSGDSYRNCHNNLMGV